MVLRLSSAFHHANVRGDNTPPQEKYQQRLCRSVQTSRWHHAKHVRTIGWLLYVSSQHIPSVQLHSLSLMGQLVDVSQAIKTTLRRRGGERVRPSGLCVHRLRTPTDPSCMQGYRRRFLSYWKRGAWLSRLSQTFTCVGSVQLVLQIKTSTVQVSAPWVTTRTKRASFTPQGVTGCDVLQHCRI